MTTLNMSLGWRRALRLRGGWDARLGITDRQKDMTEGCWECGTRVSTDIAMEWAACGDRYGVFTLLPVFGEAML